VSEKGVDAAAIRDAVDLFQERLLADPVVAAVWIDAGLTPAKSHQRALLVQALGGPSLHSARDLLAGHAGLGITDDQFARTLAHLVASLRDVGVAADVVERATSDVQALRPLIVDRTRPAAPGAS
jgi:hemoglobin